MKLTDFLMDKLISIFASVITAAFTAILLQVLGAGTYAGGFAAGFILLAQAAALILEFFRKREFFDAIQKNLESLDKKFLLSEMLEEPSFYEGKVLYNAIKAANKSMNDEISKYSRASREYREYIETWVHEVKTPISASRLIIENHPDEVTLNLNEELSKIENYVDQALFYCRSNNVEKDYVIKQTTLTEIVSSALRKHSRSLIEGKISVETSALDKPVFTDLKWTDFILGQILMNAVKYRSELPKIQISGVQNENSVTLILSDNGIGIPQKDIGRVFEKGFTGTNGRTAVKSTGIGLYLCKKLCDKLNLGISITSGEESGTIVSIVFPQSNMFA